MAAEGFRTIRSGEIFMITNMITTEREDLFDVSITIAIGIDVSGKCDRERIENAFEQSIKAHEILNTKVFIDEEGRAGYCDNGVMNNRIMFTDKDIITIIKEQEKIRFKIENGEFLRAFVIETLESGNSFKLLFLMHHLGGDGKSLVYYIETFMSALAGLDIEFTPMRLISSQDIKFGKLPAFYKVWLNGKNRKWGKNGKIFSFEDLQKSHDLYWGKNESEVDIKTYDTAQLFKMKEKCKEGGYHLTAYFITDYLKEHDGVQDVGLAVDARSDNNRAMGNQATGISVKMKYDKSKSFDANALKVQKELNRKLNNPTYKYFVLRFMEYMSPTLVDAINLEHTGYFNSDFSKRMADTLGYGEKVRDIGITNLMKLDIPLEYGTYKIERAIFIPPVISYGRNIVGMVTCGDELVVARHRLKDMSDGN